MADDQTIASEFGPNADNLLSKAKYPRTQELPETNSASIAMAGWTPEDWKLPADAGSFPILNICPDAPAYFADAGHFTVRDLRNIVSFLDLDVDYHDAEQIYQRVLSLCGEAPWTMPLLEAKIAEKRLQNGGSKARRQEKQSLVLNKMPLSKLRLKENKLLHNRVGELLSSPVQTDIAVAAFCEYAIQSYSNICEDMNPSDMFEEAKKLLLRPSPLVTIAKELGNVADVEDWGEHAAIIVNIAHEHAGTVSPELHLHAITALTQFTQTISPATTATSLFTIADLASIAAHQAREMEAPPKDVILAQVTRLGLDHDPDRVDDASIAVLSVSFVEGLSTCLCDQSLAISELEESVADLRAKIAVAGEHEDYALLAELAPLANAEKSALSAAQATRSKLLACLESLLSGEVENHDSALAEIRAHLANCADVNPDSTDANPASSETFYEMSEDGDLTPESAEESAEDVIDEIEAHQPAEECLTELSVEIPAEDSAHHISQPLQIPEYAEGPQEAGVDPSVSESPTGAPPTHVIGSTPPEITSQSTAASAAEIQLHGDTSQHTADAGISADLLPADHASAIDAASPVPIGALAELIDRDLLGIAADAAQSFETKGHLWPIKSVVLRAAAGSRTTHREYGPDTQRFQKLANQAASEISSELDSILLLGALIRPSILDKSSSAFRSILHDLGRGSLGQHLQQTIEAISDLDYDFPPNADALARLSGTHHVPQKSRLTNQLGQWIQAVGVKTSRWPFATMLLHHVASNDGPIGAARAAIVAGNSNAATLARESIDTLFTSSGIEALASNFKSQTGKPNAGLHPKGIEYLARQFDEPLALLDAWIRAAEREGSLGQKSEARLRTTISNLASRLEKAQAGLLSEAETSTSPLTAATARWIARQIKETMAALRGKDTGSFATMEEALTAEQDLLPSSVREVLDDPEKRLDAFCDLLLSDTIPDPEDALSRAREEGAFETAARLATRFGIDVHDALTNDMRRFAETWEAEISARSRRLTNLAKVDYKHQEEIGRWLAWCEIALGQLAAIKDGSEIHDLAHVSHGAAELDDICDSIQEKIREDQVARIAQYRSDINSEEADDLLAALKDITVEAAEDRIAQLRDGRSAAIFETELGGLISDLVPGFLAYAASADWPENDADFEMAIAADGPLFIEEDRRGAGLGTINLYRAVVATTRQRQPDGSKIRALFEDIGYDNVKIHDFRPVGRTGIWQGQLGGTIQIARSGGWFLPPIFGSHASSGAGTQFLIIGRDTLIENVVKALSPDVPSILLFAGVVDATKRRELAEQMRAQAIPALLIDEALIAFAATRRQTRSRIIFECGLPYGRIEPYVTDAGKLAPEMFFGRGEEMRLIMSKTADGCLVYGGRQLGKSALLAHIARIQHSPAQDRIVVNREVRSLGNSEKTTAIWSHLASMLSPKVVRPASRTAEEVSRDIRGWLTQKPHGRIVAMFDEADNFMDADTRNDYPELASLKKLMEETGRAFKVVFAGLHNVQRMSHQPNSPLAHLGQPICIGPLNRTEDDKRAAHDLVVSPMRAAGFRFEKHEDVEAILAWANYYPSLVQEYMKGLLSTLHGTGSGKTYRLPDGDPLWPIPSGTLFAHRGFSHIENRIRSKFHLTLGLDPRYALVAYTLGRLNVEGQEQKARVTGFEASELLQEARIFWPRSSEAPSLASFEALLEELFDLGVLGRVRIPNSTRYRYLLGSRQVATMLGSEDDIYHALGEIENKDPVVAYDRAIHRRRYTARSVSGQSDWHYCPLTDLQIERIVQPEEATVQIVCGLDALGLTKVGTSMERIAETGRLPGAGDHGLAVKIVRSTKELRAQVELKTSGPLHAILVFAPESAKEAHDALAWLERQPQVINKQVRPLILLDAAETEMRDIATRRPDQSQFLSAWGAEMIRIHLSQIEQVELDTQQLRNAILNSTGGVPSEVIKLIAEMRLSYDPLEAATTWKATIKVPASLLGGPLGQVLTMFDMDDGDDQETFNELLRGETGVDLVDVGPDLLATGLASYSKSKGGRLGRSALGDFLSRQIDQ